MVLNVNFSVLDKFHGSEFQETLVKLDHPLRLSLNRFKQKMLYNSHLNEGKSQKGYFITLTISDDHYAEICQNQSLSHFWKKNLTRMRNWVKRKGFGFKYAWRIERGYRGTQRLHIHWMLLTEMDGEKLKEYIHDTWVYCDWEKLEKFEKTKDWFQSLDERNKQEVYMCKYFGKTKTDKETQSVIRTKGEMKFRLYGTSKHYVAKPKQFYMVYEPEMKTWAAHRNAGWFYVDSEYGQFPITETHYKPRHMQFFKYQSTTTIRNEIAKWLIDNKVDTDHGRWQKILEKISRRFQEVHPEDPLNPDKRPKIKRKLTAFEPFWKRDDEKLNLVDAFRLLVVDNGSFPSFFKLKKSLCQLSDYEVDLLPKMEKKVGRPTMDEIRSL